MIFIVIYQPFLSCLDLLRVDQPLLNYLVDPRLYVRLLHPRLYVRIMNYLVHPRLYVDHQQMSFVIYQVILRYCLNVHSTVGAIQLPLVG